MHFPALETTLTTEALATGSRHYAGGLRADGVRAGDVVGILCPTSPEFLLSFFGILRAGATACPLPLPATLASLDAYMRDLAATVQRIGISRVLVPQAAQAMVQEFGSLVPGLRSLPAEALKDSPPLDAASHEDATSPSLVQLSSGTTSTPRGAILTHDAISACAAAIASAIAVSPQDVHGLWIPLFHDMGLVATVSGLLHGVTQYLWPPTAFIRDPGGWLASFAAQRGSIHAGPNFAYEYLLASIDDDHLATLDLSAWRIAFNGAEPISPHTLQRFLGRFRPAGFRPEAMFPVYGLAEATLAVTFPPLGAAPIIAWFDGPALADERRVIQVPPGSRGARGLVGVGRPLAGVSVRIVDDEGCPAGPDTVGEIQVRGPSVMAGYLGPPEASWQAFQDGWLRTGDLGFFFNGSLFIAARMKEVIIVRGQKVHPETVEGVVRELPEVFKRRCAAFGTDNGDTERVTVVVEMEPHRHAARDVRRRVQTQLAATLGLGDIAVYPVAPRSIPRTTSGKIRRTQTRQLLLTGRLTVVDQADENVSDRRS
jgi:fatty-acyl-CoA synthase